MKRTAVAGSVLLMILFGTTMPAQAYHGEAVDGIWSATDVNDGSFMILTIRETDPDAGMFFVRLHDTWTNFGGPATVTATGQFYNDITGQMNVEWEELTFRGKTSLGGSYEIFYEESNGTLTDDSGNTWYHISG